MSIVRVEAIEMVDRIDNRYLGALRCIDRATGATLTRMLHVEADNARFFRNRSSLYVIASAPGLASYTGQFINAPDTPVQGAVLVNAQISDPLDEYLPRRVEIALPRDADPENRTQADSLFQPMPVALYPAPNADLRINWSTVRVALVRDQEGNDQPVTGALLRVIRNEDGEVLSSGLSDPRGEALIIVPGVPITQFADDEDEDDEDDDDDDEAASESPVVVSETAATLEVSVASGSDWPVDPDELELNHATNLVASENLTLRTGRMEKLTIRLT